MSKTAAKILKIAALCIAVLLTIAALFHYIPWATPVDLTLYAIELDEAGNEVGTETIHIKGHRLDYLFRDPRLDVEIEAFGPLEQIKLFEEINGTGTIHKYIEKSSAFECSYIAFYDAGAGADRNTFGALYFNNEFNHFAFVLYLPQEGSTTSSHEPYRYVASANQEDSASEIKASLHLVPDL